MPPQTALQNLTPSPILRPATLADVRAIHRVRQLAAADLTQKFGLGDWSHISIIGTLVRAVFDHGLYAFVEDGNIIGTLTLGPKAPSFYKPSWFAKPAEKALYLRSFSITPLRQRRGFGRQAMLAAEDMARHCGIHSIRLDSYDRPAGAGGFYERCGYQQVATTHFYSEAMRVFEKLL